MTDFNRATTFHQEPALALNAGRARTRRLSPSSFLAPLKSFKKKMGTFVRRLCGGKERNANSCNAPRGAVLHWIETPVAFDSELNGYNGAHVLEGMTNNLYVSPSRGVPYELLDALLEEEEDTGPCGDGPTLVNGMPISPSLSPSSSVPHQSLGALLDDHGDSGTRTRIKHNKSDTGELHREESIDVPRRVRSRLPCEEEPPCVEPGTVSQIIAKFNSANSFEFGQASSIVKQRSLLQLSPAAHCVMSKMSSSADRSPGPDSRERISDSLSLTQPSAVPGESESSWNPGIFAVSSPTRINGQSSLFQEKNSSYFRHCDMGSSQASHCAVTESADLNCKATNPVILPPRDEFPAPAGQKQQSYALNVANHVNESKQSEVFIVEDGADVVASGIPTFVHSSESQVQSDGSGKVIMPHVPRGLSCDSYAESNEEEQVSEGQVNELAPNEGAVHMQQGQRDGMRGGLGFLQESDGYMRVGFPWCACLR